MPDAIDELVDWQLTQFKYSPWRREIFQLLSQPSYEDGSIQPSGDAARWNPKRGWFSK